MRVRIAATISLVLSLNLALSAMVIRNYAEQEENGNRTESGVFHEDYLFLGHELNFSGEAEDLLFLGKSLTFSGKTELGLLALGEKVVYSGQSGNGIMAGCLNMVVDGSITGNSYVGCKSFRLSEIGSINGNLFVGCAKLRIDGALKGDLYAGAGEILINSQVNGNVTAYGGRIIIGDKGRINGNLTYSSKERLSDAELARVSGTVTVDEKHAFDKKDMFPSGAAKWIKFFICLGMFVSFVVVGSLLLFLPAFRKLDGKPETFWKTGLWGLIPLLMYPAIVVLCIGMVVTIPFAVVLLLAGIPLLFLAYLIGVTLTGQYVVTKFKWDVRKRHYHFLIGALVAGVFSAIPFVNFLAFIFISSLGFGVYLSFLFGKDVTTSA